MTDLLAPSPMSGRRVHYSGINYQWRRIYPGVSSSIRRRGAL